MCSWLRRQTLAVNQTSPPCWVCPECLQRAALRNPDAEILQKPPPPTLWPHESLVVFTPAGCTQSPPCLQGRAQTSDSPKLCLSAILPLVYHHDKLVEFAWPRLLILGGCVCPDDSWEGWWWWSDAGWVFQCITLGEEIVGGFKSRTNQPWRDQLNLAWGDEVGTLCRFPLYGNA